VWDWKSKRTIVLHVEDVLGSSRFILMKFCNSVLVITSGIHILLISDLKSFAEL